MRSKPEAVGTRRSRWPRSAEGGFFRAFIGLDARCRYRTTAAAGQNFCCASGGGLLPLSSLLGGKPKTLLK
jgi:hypothetical protein